MPNTDFSLTRDDVITDALEALGVLADGDSPSSNQLTTCTRTFNSLIKHLQADGLNIYAVKETFLFLIKDRAQYDQLDYDGENGLSVDREHIYVSRYEKVDFTDIASGATSVEVNESFISGDPVASAVAGDVVGIPLEDGTVHWADITAVGTSGSFNKSYTFSGHALPSDADNTKKMIVGVTYPGRPIEIVTASVRQVFNDRERPIIVSSISDFSDLNQKTTTGSEANQIMYHRENETGDLRVWPVPNDYNHCLVLWVQTPLDDVDTDVDLNTTVGFPQEYSLALVYNLAEALIPKFAPPAYIASRIERLAYKYLEEARPFNSSGYIEIEPEYYG